MNVLSRYCICFLLAFIYSLKAQPSIHSSEQLNRCYGLISNEISDIVQDRNGFFWIFPEVSFKRTAINPYANKANFTNEGGIGSGRDIQKGLKWEEIYLGHLTPGNYTLILRPLGTEGVLTPSPYQLHFTVRKPFVKTLWFYFLILLFLCAILFGWYKYRLITFSQLEKLRTQISHDLHDDIGSHLTNISLMSQMAAQEKGMISQKENLLDKIQEESQAVFEGMREILWNINPNNDSVEKAMPRLLQFASDLLEKKNIKLHASIADLTKIKMDMDRRRDLSLIFKEALHNIIRHSGAQNVWITAEKKNKILKLQIVDDGKGFQITRLPHKNGLDHMAERAQKHHWKFSIVTHPEKVTQVLLEVGIP